MKRTPGELRKRANLMSWLQRSPQPNKAQMQKNTARIVHDRKVGNAVGKAFAPKPVKTKKK